jgi:hypothetical protein
VSKTNSQFNCSICDDLSFIETCSHSSREKYRKGGKAEYPKALVVPLGSLATFQRPAKVKYRKARAKHTNKSLTVIMRKVDKLERELSNCDSISLSRKIERQIRHNERKVMAQCHNSQTGLRSQDYQSIANDYRVSLDYFAKVKYVYCIDCAVFSKKRSKTLLKNGVCGCGSSNIREYSGFRRIERLS